MNQEDIPLTLDHIKARIAAQLCEARRKERRFRQKNNVSQMLRLNGAFKVAIQKAAYECGQSPNMFILHTVKDTIGYKGDV